MDRKQKKILVGMAIVTLAGRIVAEIGSVNDAGYLVFVGIPLVLGCGWAFIVKDQPKE
jgi:hypothetical protein